MVQTFEQCWPVRNVYQPQAASKSDVCLLQHVVMRSQIPSAAAERNLFGRQSEQRSRFLSFHLVKGLCKIRCTGDVPQDFTKPRKA